MHPFRRHRRSYRVAYALALSAGCLALAGCVTDDTVARRTGAGPDVATAASDPQIAQAAPVSAPVTAPKRRTAAAAFRDPVGYSAVGLASWYGAEFHGRRTADGERFDMHALTAAHRTLPLQCTVRVTNLANNRSVLVRVNDRGPFAGHRLIDLSAQSAKVLGFYRRGLAKVKVDYVGPASAAAEPRVTASAGSL
jgi:rare lipoprotein A